MANKKNERKKKSRVCVKECVVKRRGTTETFDVRKVYGSCYHACRSAHLTEKESEKMCDKVCNEAKKWIEGRKSVTSQQIFRFVAKELRKHNKDASYMYVVFRDIS